MAPSRWLRLLEKRLEEGGEDALGEALLLLAAGAGRAVDVDPDEVHGACRRALLLLATGGDPQRALDLRGRAVEALARDLDTSARRRALAAGLADLAGEAAGLMLVGELVRELADDPETAWRAWSASLLLESLDDD